jgi:hypothetical protein
MVWALTVLSLHLAVTQRLAGYAEGTAERREALATLALIRRVIAQRQSDGNSASADP